MVKTNTAPSFLHPKIMPYPQASNWEAFGGRAFCRHFYFFFGIFVSLYATCIIT